MWGIFSFVINKRDKRADDDRTSFMLTSKAEREHVQSEIQRINSHLFSQQKSFEDLRIAITQVTTEKKYLEDHYKRLEKVLDRHEEKLDSFGKVILK